MPRHSMELPYMPTLTSLAPPLAVSRQSVLAVPSRSRFGMIIGRVVDRGSRCFHRTAHPTPATPGVPRVTRRSKPERASDRLHGRDPTAPPAGHGPLGAAGEPYSSALEGFHQLPEPTGIHWQNDYRNGWHGPLKTLQAGSVPLLAAFHDPLQMAPTQTECFPLPLFDTGSVKKQAPSPSAW